MASLHGSTPFSAAQDHLSWKMFFSSTAQTAHFASCSVYFLHLSISWPDYESGIPLSTEAQCLLWEINPTKDFNNRHLWMLCPQHLPSWTCFMVSLLCSHRRKSSLRKQRWWCLYSISSVPVFPLSRALLVPRFVTGVLKIAASNSMPNTTEGCAGPECLSLSWLFGSGFCHTLPLWHILGMICSIHCSGFASYKWCPELPPGLMHFGLWAWLETGFAVPGHPGLQTLKTL